ncbi:MAG: hypothetical protein AB7G13_35565, partial [Lautropia sp.]
FRSWRKRAPADATLTFLCEMGPKEYAMTGPDGYELSDRWQEAQLLMRLVRALWDRLEQEERPEQSRAMPASAAAKPAASVQFDGAVR